MPETVTTVVPRPHGWSGWVIEAEQFANATTPDLPPLFTPAHPASQYAADIVRTIFDPGNQAVLLAGESILLYIDPFERGMHGVGELFGKRGWRIFNDGGEYLRIAIAPKVPTTPR